MSLSPGSRSLNVMDAMTYLETIKVEFQHKPDVYDRFMDIMRDFRSEVINTPEVINQVLLLFNKHITLIQDFNAFLPQGYRVNCTTDDHNHSIITVLTPSGTSTRTTTTD
ncbi:Transcriptional regulatory protein SIN3 [Rhizoctonia solani AG-1 IB]|nr:Transcriptional regulatory protein SIN3 [Rhizoctonia solani AG-1 IB]